MGLGKPPAPTLEEAYEKAQAALAAIELPLKLDGGATVTRCFADFRVNLDTSSGRTRRRSPPFSCRSSWMANRCHQVLQRLYSERKPRQGEMLRLEAFLLVCNVATGLGTESPM